MKKILKHVSIFTLSLVLCLSLLGCELALKTRETGGGGQGEANAPVFHGVEDITIEKGSAFIPLEGVTVTDEEDGNINLSAVSVDAHEVNVNVEGQYSVIYTVYDSDGNKTTAVRIVTVVYTDTVQPEIYGAADLSVTVGDLSFDLLKDVSAVDNLDGEVEVTCVGEVNIWVPGEYPVTYSAVDAAGNEKSLIRTITVGLGNFEFSELADLPQNLQISGGEILATIAPYSLVKFVLQVSAESADLVFGLEGASLPQMPVHVEGTQEIVLYARIEQPLENAQCSVTSNDAFQIISAKYGFAGAGDHEAPVFTRSISEDIYVPTGVSAEFAKRELLRGITAADNLDGNVTSQIQVDLQNANLNAAGAYPVVLKVSDALGNEAIYEMTLNVAVPRDAHVMTDPEFNETDTTQIKLSSGAGGQTSYAIVNGEYVLTITKAGGWASGDSPYLSGISTNQLAANHYYVFGVDVKADVARAMQIRAGLELWTDPWIENFRDTTKFQITTEWQTIYYVFYVPSATSSVGSNVVKFELQLGSIDWSDAENNNVVYFDNMQFYLLTNDNDLPVITIDESKPTTFAKDAEMPDFKEYFSASDTEDGQIAITDEMLDLSDVNMAVAGDYEVILTVVDSNGGQTLAVLQIKVIEAADTEGPVISVPAIVLQQLASYMPVKEGTDLTSMFQMALGYVTITDNVDGEITPTLEMLDLDGLSLTSPKVGTYAVKIQTADSSGNLSNVVEFEVSVYDGTAPVLVGVRNLKVYPGETLNPLAGICAVDSNDGVIHLALADISGFEQFLDANGKVIGAAGEYQVSYVAKDAAGNEATANAVVTVGAEAPEYHESNVQDFLVLNQPLGGGNSSTITYENGIGTINYLGAQSWWASALQLKYTDKVKLVAGTTYKLVFEAKADLPRELVVYFVDGAGNKIPGFEGDGGQLTKLKIALTDEYYVFEYEFTPTSASSATSTLEFDFEWESYLLNSGVANTISIKQIKIVAQGPEQGGEQPGGDEYEEVLKMDFEELTVQTDFSDPHWTVEMYTTQWDPVTTTQMRVRSVDGSKVVNMASGYGMSYRYTYTADALLENISKFSMKLSNHYNGADIAKIQICLVLEDDSVIFVAGDYSAFYEFPVTTGLVDIEKELAEPVNLKGFYIVFQSALNSAYIYMDDVVFAKIKAEEPDPQPQVEYEDVLLMDFEELTAQSDFVDSHWKIERYSDGWQTMTSVQMRVRSVDGSKVVNMAGGYGMSYRYTYTADATLEDIACFGIKLSNHYSGSLAKVKIAAILEDDSIMYLLGSADAYYELEVTTGRIQFTKELEQAVNVKGFYIVFNSSNGNGAFLYMDDVQFAKVKSQGGEPDPQPQEPEYEEVLKMDFEELTVQTDFSDSHWKVETYTTQWDAVTSTQMRVRAIGNTKVVNMASGYNMSMRYTYTADAILEGVQHFEIKLSNHFSGASVAKIQIAIVLEDDSVIFVAGDYTSFAEFPVTTGLVPLSKDLDAPVNVKGFYIVFQSALNSAYLYMDDIVIAKIK